MHLLAAARWALNVMSTVGPTQAIFCQTLTPWPQVPLNPVPAWPLILTSKRTRRWSPTSNSKPKRISHIFHRCRTQCFLFVSQNHRFQNRSELHYLALLIEDFWRPFKRPNLEIVESFKFICILQCYSLHRKRSSLLLSNISWGPKRANMPKKPEYSLYRKTRSRARL